MRIGISVFCILFVPTYIRVGYIYKSFTNIVEFKYYIYYIAYNIYIKKWRYFMLGILIYFMTDKT